ncbi:MAG TPA: DUF2085 domain-containing protein [Roseiflexaceae bacterium]|nr:DUF2085 domain-containing protein [Roseiflexaceae bacterium]
MAVITARISRPLQWRGLIADAVLVVLLSGPLAAPFLQAWGLLVPRTVSGIIYTMGMFVCPQPAYGLPVYDGQIMAVCMRCYGSVLGLLLTRLLYATDGGAGRLWLPHYRKRALPVFAAMIFTYAAEFAGQVAGWWGFNNLVVTAAGLVTGAGLGLMFHPMLQSRSQLAAAK